jgi:hypothetical protein
MADTLNNTQNPVDNTLNNSPVTPSPTPIVPQTPVDPSIIPPIDPNAPVNTGEQYEVEKLAPEDLDVQWTRWKCLVCNYIYEGSKPLKKCPRCGNEDPDKFEDID